MFSSREGSGDIPQIDWTLAPDLGLNKSPVAQHFHFEMNTKYVAYHTAMRGRLLSELPGMPGQFLRTGNVVGTSPPTACEGCWNWVVRGEAWNCFYSNM